MTNTERPFPESRTVAVVGYGDGAAEDINKLLLAGGGKGANPLAEEVIGVALFQTQQNWHKIMDKNPGLPRRSFRQSELSVNRGVDEAYNKLHSRFYKNDSARVMLHFPDYTSQRAATFGLAHANWTKSAMRDLINYSGTNDRQTGIDHYAVVLTDSTVHLAAEEYLSTEEFRKLGMGVITINEPSTHLTHAKNQPFLTRTFLQSLVGLMARSPFEDHLPNYQQVLKAITAPTGYASLGAGEQTMFIPREYGDVDTLRQHMISKGHFAILDSLRDENWLGTNPRVSSPLFSVLIYPTAGRSRNEVTKAIVPGKIMTALAQDTIEKPGIEATVYLRSREMNFISKGGGSLISAGTFAPEQPVVAHS